MSGLGNERWQASLRLVALLRMALDDLNQDIVQGLYGKPPSTTYLADAQKIQRNLGYVISVAQDLEKGCSPL